MNTNQKDPLCKTGPNAEKELFHALSACCDGFPSDMVINAAANMIINAVRQSQATKQGAEKFMDEIIGKTKAILIDLHYDSTGRRKGIFPYDQHIVMGHFMTRTKVHR